MMVFDGCFFPEAMATPPARTEDQHTNQVDTSFTCHGLELKISHWTGWEMDDRITVILEEFLILVQLIVRADCRPSSI